MSRYIKAYQIALLICLGISSCNSTPLTKEEIEWRHAIDRENWALCKKAYRQAGQYLIFDHAHDDNEKPALLRSDLLRNTCRMILRDYWIEY